MMCLCNTKLRTFQHGYPGYLGALQKKSGSNDTKFSYESYFFDFENDKIGKKTSDFRLMSIKTVWKKNLMSFPFLDFIQCH